MALSDFLKEIDEEVKILNSSDFTIEITDTNYVPRYDDPNITFGNLDSKVKKVKRLESCVLYVDMRNSAQISSEKMPRTLAKVYSSFVNSMIAAGRYYGGHIRNIIGDRVMVVFDKEKCFKKAVDTAVLMNTIAHHTINKHVKNIDFKCGIGLDYGTMLITKTGIYRKGAEKDFYRSLVWLGKPANIASRLTDIANKTINDPNKDVNVAYSKEYQFSNWNWRYCSFEQFVDDLQKTPLNRIIRHSDPAFISFYKVAESVKSTKLPAILMTESVYNGYKAENSDDPSVRNVWWREQINPIKEYKGKIYGGSVYYSIVDKI